MKKLLALFLTSAIALSTTACSSQKKSVSDNENIQGKPAPQISSVDLSGEISGEITVSCYETVPYKNYLEEAAQAFEEKYPHTKINIETFSAMPEVRTTTTEDGKKISMMVINEEDDNSKNDYINKINTELMSGGGADILAIDVLPYYKYVENGQLENLSQYMESDENFDLSNYRQNILEATKYKGGQYVFPMNYSFEYLSYDTTLLNSEAQEKINQKDIFTYEELTEIALNSFADQEAMEEASKMFNLNGGIPLFQVLFKEYYNEFLDIPERTANFNDGKFVEILELAKEYGEKGYVNESLNKTNKEANRNAMAKNFVEGMDGGTSLLPRYFYQKNDQMGLIQEFNDSMTNNKRAAINIRSGNSGNSEDTEIGGLFSNEQGEVNFSFRQGYGINTNSQNKKTAWEFIKFLASEEMQSSMYLLGRPINNQAAEERAKMEITGQLFNPEENNGTAELTEDQERIYQEYTAVLDKFADQLNTYLIKDSTIDEMVSSEVASFFDSTKTAEEVAEILQNKVELYLNE